MLLDRKLVRPSHRRDHRAECYGKVSFCSKGAAIECIKRREKKRKINRGYHGWAKGMSLMPYRCSYCHHWHIGGTDREDAKPLRRRKDYEN